MKLTPDDVKIYQKVFQKKMGYSIGKNDAYRRLQKLVTQMELIRKAVTIDDLRDLEKYEDEYRHARRNRFSNI